MKKKKSKLHLIETQLKTAIKNPQASRVNKNSITENSINSKSEFFPTGTCCHYIYDVSRGYFTSIDENIYEITGYMPNEIIFNDTVEFLKQVIIEDHLMVIPTLITKSFNLAKEYRHLESVVFNLEYNIRSKSGEMKRILGQFKTLEFEEDGYPRINQCSFTDITHIKKDGIPLLFVISNNKLLYLEKADAGIMIKSDKIIFSKKEIEIMKLISEGHNVKKIASLLHTTVSTIYTHRKNIKKKSEDDIHKIIFDLKERGVF
jgi:hypothetical protein